TKNSPILGDSVIAITAGQKDIQWIGTEQGISGMYNNKWLSPLDDDMYPDYYFELFPITTMATDLQGDSLYVATIGAGVGRFYKNDVDGITGASTYAEWGPIKMPSDNVYSICITEEAQWFGTDKGIAKHVGYNTLENWTIYNKGNGLVDNFVQTMAFDSSGKLWVGTKGGLSVFDGSEWTNYTIQDGLTSNNILCIICDKHGTVYLGTDNGFIIWNNGHIICYQ
ncbi:two-component regulator propeller domain-containing protein, partial [Bacteroidota bacterium]